MRPDALRGHLDALILAAVEHEPLHGYAVMEALLRRSGGRRTLAAERSEWRDFAMVISNVLGPVPG